MRAAALSLVPLLAAPVYADYASDLMGALNGMGLTTLASVLGNVSTTDAGKGLVNLIANEGANYTFFAPNNQGFSGAFPNTTTLNTSDPGLVSTLKYHVVSGNLQNYTSKYPNTTIGRTFLNASNLVQLEGDKSQVIAWSTYGDTGTFILNQNTHAKIVNQTVWRNLAINVVDAVIDVPGNLSNALVANNLTTLTTLLKSLPGPKAGQMMFDYLNKDARGFTLFAPNDDALKSAMSNQTIAALLTNSTIVSAVIGNHLVNGSSIYSSNLYMNATSASGQPIMAGSNGTVMSGASTVNIVSPDLILKNGVVHIMSGVFLNTESNPAAASAAAESATSVAGTAPATTETAPIGNTATFSQTGTPASQASSSSSGGSGSGNGAVALGVSRAAIAVSVFGALVGAVVTLA